MTRNSDSEYYAFIFVSLFIRRAINTVLEALNTFLSKYFSKFRTSDFDKYPRMDARKFSAVGLAFDRNGGARFGGARGRAGPHRFDQMQNESIFVRSNVAPRSNDKKKCG